MDFTSGLRKQKSPDNSPTSEKYVDEMNVTIVGGGRTGVALVKRLLKTEHRPTVVEIDEERANYLASELDALVIHGNGADIDVLKEARVERADVLAALTANDEVNLMVCKIAKDMAVPRIVSRISRSEYSQIFEDLGVDVTISSIGAITKLFEKAISRPRIYGLMGHDESKADVIEVSVKENSKAEGKSIQKINLPDLCTISLVIREGKLIPPRGNTVFRKGDRIILAGKSEDVISTSKIFREG